MKNYIQQITDFVLNTKYEDISSEAIELAKVALIDYVGVTLAGAVEDSSKYTQDYAKTFGAIGTSTIYGTNLKTHPALAALCNGVASHANDYDDCSETEIGHPSITVMPATLAMAEMLNSSGEDTLKAYVIAVEVQNKISVLALPETSKRGWHTTCVFGHFGSCIAAAILLKLNAEQIKNAIGIACSQAGGIRANFGTMTKPYHAGHASYNGITAAFLAKNGMSAADDALENPQGFIKLFSDRDFTEYQDLKLAQPWDIVSPGFQIKVYPSCSASHPASEALFNILKTRDIKPSDVKSIHAGIGLLGISELLCHDPKTPDEARFSMEYALAAPIVYGKITIDEFKEEAILNPEIRELIPKITMAVDDELALLGLTADEPCKLTVELNNGEVIKERCMLAKGQPNKRLTKEELKEKFITCSMKSYSFEACERLFDIANNFEKEKDLTEFLKVMKEDK